MAQDTSERQVGHRWLHRWCFIRQLTWDNVFSIIQFSAVSSSSSSFTFVFRFTFRELKADLSGDSVAQSDPRATHDDPAGGEVRARDDAQELRELDLRVIEDGPERGRDLSQVVGREARRHTL